MVSSATEALPVPTPFYQTLQLMASTVRAGRLSNAAPRPKWGVCNPGSSWPGASLINLLTTLAGRRPYCHIVNRSDSIKEVKRQARCASVS